MKLVIFYLGHFEDDFMTYEEKESEANFLQSTVLLLHH